MKRTERVIRIVKAIIENKRAIRDILKKEGNKERAACYMKEILEWNTFEVLLTDDGYLALLEKIYIEGKENE